MRNVTKLTSRVVLQFENKQFSATIKRKESVVESLESEIAQLSCRISVLKNGADADNESGAIVSSVKELENEKQKLTKHVAQLEDDLKRAKRFEAENRMERTELANALEKVTLLEAALKQANGSTVAESALQKMQEIWEKLGTSMKDREEVQTQIENCLDDTCKRKLEEAREQLENSLKLLAHETTKMQVMYSSLAEDIPMLSECNQPTYQHLDEVKTRSKQIEAWFEAAVKRRDEIADQAQKLAASLEMGIESLNDDLQLVINEASQNQNRFCVAAHLDEKFLSNCENHLRCLRIEKSKTTAKYASIQIETQKLVSDMNLSESTIIPLVQDFLSKQSLELPAWWRNEIAQAVALSLVSENGFSRHTTAYVKHLSKIHDIIVSVALARQNLSIKLKEVVQKAQNTLLDIVDGEIDAKEAYSSFHDALFRLPPLSKEMINACNTEIDALLTGVQSMIQSEIEALTVVWEALDISSSKRGKFWGDIQESMRAMDSTLSNLFAEDSSEIVCDLEEWILPAREKAAISFLELEKRLFKLQRIHREVERLSAKQDAKSRIISLDSEIRILNAKLAEFEEKKCDKERLITKKATSSTLLKEERYRKQMQSKFSTKFAQLASLLKTWSNDDDGLFDPHLLSEEVRSLLANSNEIDSLVEKRTEFMHLRTIQSKVSNKRKVDGEEVRPRKAAKTQVRDTEKVLPLRARLDTRKNSPVPTVAITKKETPLKLNKIEASKAGRRPLSTKVDPIQSPKVLSPKKKLTLPPFGHVLEKAFTPREKEKENEVV